MSIIKIKRIILKYANKMKNNVLTIVFLLFFCFIFPQIESKAEGTNRIISLIPSSTEIIFAIGFGEENFFWSTSDYGDRWARYRKLYYMYTDMIGSNSGEDIRSGFSVRCIRN